MSAAKDDTTCPECKGRGFDHVELRRAARRVLSPDGTEAGWVEEQLHA